MKQCLVSTQNKCSKTKYSSKEKELYNANRLCQTKDCALYIKKNKFVCGITNAGTNLDHN